MWTIGKKPTDSLVALNVQVQRGLCCDMLEHEILRCPRLRFQNPVGFVQLVRVPSNLFSHHSWSERPNEPNTECPMMSQFTVPTCDWTDSQM